MSQAQIEKVKPDFNQLDVLGVRERSWKVLAAIVERIQPGMLEEEAYEVAKAVLTAQEVEKSWHRPYVRFGSNTLKMYGEPSVPGVRLGENDIYFLDIGPVFSGYEGDVGDTFVTGSDPEMLRCAGDARILFAQVKEEWKGGCKSGIELYGFAEKKARDLGWKLHLGVNGHRLADFPHAAYFKGALTDATFAPSPYVWVLEIQIRHPERDFGAFYEDLLY